MESVYRGMDRAALDRGYNNTKAVAHFPEIFSQFQARSADLYRSVSCRRDIAYGPGKRERLDWFSCGVENAPVFVFIHGGYWQNGTKEDFSFVASGPLGCGFDVALVEYTLAPEASMTLIVQEIGRLLDYLSGAGNEFGVGGRRVCLSGHSAGGQLSAVYRSHPAVTHVMPISALVDLEPISLCWLNEKLRLTSGEINDYSPLYDIGTGAPMTVTVGAAELPELVRHSREYADACRLAGEAVTYHALPDRDHFSILDDLASPSGVQMTLLKEAMSR
ncbi:alpha/beta hydrolase [Paraburkholderia xenovorans]|uniref:alpha/beta hydrolase n=1 Tax=Paraburkholderia xenovorans TaxID=36873 RepID=UPI0038B9F319